jgi:hypothetical protein
VFVHHALVAKPIVENEVLRLSPTAQISRPSAIKKASVASVLCGQPRDPRTGNYTSADLQRGIPNVVMPPFKKRFPAVQKLAELYQLSSLGDAGCVAVQGLAANGVEGGAPLADTADDGWGSEFWGRATVHGQEGESWKRHGG